MGEAHEILREIIRLTDEADFGELHDCAGHDDHDQSYSYSSPEFKVVMDRAKALLARNSDE